MTFDVLAELEPYMDRLSRNKVVDGKFLSCSPFRDDTRPSFVVFLDNGNWVDSGNTEKRAGSFLELLTFLSGDDWESVKHGLNSKYGDIVDADSIDLKIELNIAPSIFAFDATALDQYKFRHPYLTNRGITEKIQRAFKIGYCRNSKAVVIPWTNDDGDVVKLKFRTVEGKKFWYCSDGDRIKNHVFGLQFVKKHQFKTVWIVEAEIDCMYLWSNGIPAIATGTSSISPQQLKLLKRSSIETLVIASDNDDAGGKFKQQLTQELGGVVQLKSIEFPNGAKDINDITTQALILLSPTNLLLFTTYF